MSANKWTIVFKCLGDDHFILTGLNTNATEVELFRATERHICITNDRQIIWCIGLLSCICDQLNAHEYRFGGYRLILYDNDLFNLEVLGDIVEHYSVNGCDIELGHFAPLDHLDIMATIERQHNTAGFINAENSDIGDLDASFCFQKQANGVWEIDTSPNEERV